MPPRMTTQSAGRATAAPRGGRTGGRTGRGGGRTRGRSGDQGNGGIDGQDGQVSGQGREGDVRNVIENNDHRGCTYKEFLACNPKSMMDNQKVKYTAGSFVGKAITWWNSQIHTRGREEAVETELWNHAMVRAGHAAYTDRFHELAWLVPQLVSPENKRIERYVYVLAPQIRGMVAATEPMTIQKAVQITGKLTDEAIRNGSIKKNHEKRGNEEEPSKDRNGRDDNKRTRTENAFATTTNPVRRENTGTTPKCTTCTFYHPPKAPCRTCFNCNRP
ncbi:hypothetical protein Tco_0548938 [Tanacetum coccineum]